MITREPDELVGPGDEDDEDDSLREVGVVDDDRCLGIKVDKFGEENRAAEKVSVRFDRLMLGNSKEKLNPLVLLVVVDDESAVGGDVVRVDELLPPPKIPPVLLALGLVVLLVEDDADEDDDED